MELFNTLALFLIGFYFLIKGAHILVKGASSVARIFNLSSWVIGILIVGIGTSVPEFALTLASALEGSHVGIATLIGTNVFNVFFILGLSAVIAPLAMRREWVEKDFFIHIATFVVLLLVAVVPFAGSGDTVNRVEGIALLLFFVLWTRMVITSGVNPKDQADVKPLTLITSLGFIIAGIVGVVLGGEWVLHGSLTMATAFGVSEELIALTVLSIGTSIPEIAVTFAAFERGAIGIGVGNIIGSNIFNTLGIISIASIITPIEVPGELVFDMLYGIIGGLLLIYFMRGPKKLILDRKEGLVFLALYLVYLFVIFTRG